MANLNKKCLACAARYSYCPDCSRADALKPSWYSEFCSEPCMTLWMTLTKYNTNIIAKPEAKAIISNLELKPIDSYADCIKRDYNKLMTDEKKPKRGRRIEIKPIDEAIEIDPIVVQPIAEPVELHEVVETKEDE